MIVEQTPPKARPLKLSVTTYKNATWFDACLAEVRTASEVDIATFIFDDPEFTQTLLQRLKGHAPFSCKVYVDAQAYEKRTSRHQRPRLKELEAHGAEVLTCSGYDATALFGATAKKGVLHYKAVVLDRKTAYAGGSNVTKSSRANREFMWRFSGHPVADVIEGIQELSDHASSL